MSFRKDLQSLLWQLGCAISFGLMTASSAHGLVIANDGGITLWVSYDNLDAIGASLADTITEADSLPGGFSCGPTNTGRSAVGQPNSPPSCPGGSGSCSGAEKVTGDIEKLADYIFQSTEGSHYLRRVYVSDQGRAWTSADIKWNVGVGGSSAPVGGWAVSDAQMALNSGYRTCIHDVLHHELGHYLYSLPDRYADSSGYYAGTMGGGPSFQVNVTGRDINTVMSNNFPHLFVDTTNAEITVDYDQPGPGSTTGEVLTPSLLTDGNPNNDGPDRDHHGFTIPFATDEWSLLPSLHVDLTGTHTEGDFPVLGVRPDVDIVFTGNDLPLPGTVLLLDRSGSMGVTTNGIAAAQFVQEAGMFLYHSSAADDTVGTYLYNASVEELFPYAPYDASNDLPFVSFRNASGATNIAVALQTAIDQLIALHGEGGVSGSDIYLMSDGRQTVGSSLWDQVDRANTRGIKIHTFSFGDADTSTMDSIAMNTSASTTPMSERDDAAELKMIMARRFSTSRGRTPVFAYKGQLKPVINLGATQAYAGQFTVPPKSRALQFYAFLHRGDASRSLNIQLKAPDGTLYNSPAPDNTAQKGRFNGIKLNQAQPGIWQFTIFGRPGSGLPAEAVELAAYAGNPEMDAKVWFGEIIKPYVVPVYARLNFRYPLTDIEVVANLYAGGRLLARVPMVDDGSTGVDQQRRDGIYSTILSYSRAEWRKLMGSLENPTDKIRVEVSFAVSEKAVPANFAHYESGFSADDANTDYKRANKATFNAWATGVLNLASLDERNHQHPRLTCAQTKTLIVKPGSKGDLACRIENLRPVLSQLRVSLGQGIATSVRDSRSRIGRQPGKLGETGPLVTDFVVQYEVQRDARKGSRPLLMQFGQTQLSQRDTLEIVQ